jgi:hypothetical protein
VCFEFAPSQLAWGVIIWQSTIIWDSEVRQAQKLVALSSLCEELRTQNLSLSEQLEAKTKRIAELEAALQAAERAAHRQAAPCRIPEHKCRAQPKPPGRKAGQPGAFRQLPDQIDQFIEAGRIFLA